MAVRSCQFDHGAGRSCFIPIGRRTKTTSSDAVALRSDSAVVGGCLWLMPSGRDRLGAAVAMNHTAYAGNPSGRDDRANPRAAARMRSSEHKASPAKTARNDRSRTCAAITGAAQSLARPDRPVYRRIHVHLGCQHRERGDADAREGVRHDVRGGAMGGALLFAGCHCIGDGGRTFGRSLRPPPIVSVRPGGVHHRLIALRSVDFHCNLDCLPSRARPGRRVRIGARRGHRRRDVQAARAGPRARHDRLRGVARRGPGPVDRRTHHRAGRLALDVPRSTSRSGSWRSSRSAVSCRNRRHNRPIIRSIGWALCSPRSSCPHSHSG